ncbi:LysR family transcriptional regulator [Ottowia sp. VDI28]|uniref:LysR family transcriptional regulator n=1 Tax=Ottowia sp. VDI28 TaxID=3133968 RepID=UPI003C3064AF
MEIDDLLWFKRVAERGSVRRAAAELGVSQPALSKAIRRLEISFGLKLFERTARGVLLTDAGRTVYQRAIQISDWSLNMAADVASLKSANTGLLRVGVVPALIQALLIPAARAMLDQSRFTIRVQLSDQLFQLLSTGEIDCAIAAMDDRASNEFNHQILGQQRSMVVGRAHHPLQKRSFDVTDLGAQEWVLSPKHIVLRQWVDRFLRTNSRKELMPAIEVDATPAVLAPLIETTDLLTVLTEDALRSPACRKLRALPAPAPVWCLDIGLFWRRTAQFGPQMERFRSLVAEAYAGSRHTK